MCSTFSMPSRHRPSLAWDRCSAGSRRGAGPINNLEKAFTHTQAQARDMVQSIDFDAAVGGRFKVTGFPVKFSNTEASIRNNPPLLGEHTDDVLRGLGFSNEELADLRREKAI
ncbi:predicted protein [Histoplasma capsulatum G186AR]|uniref:Uncharacterized protein n=2 Tax=Ajellomyces capsulatus TaxID=5037 RepID=C0NT06_AJECG|nr:uncharacterized protein HCBG_06286 [Histoplasma capsulatum G186AR]EEH05167.1 predicted protein [Histoplasma capsulatum G186AR]KAG5305468.1 hypothetical protein I7I52_04141 [Histoplasma capsulatum]QSS76430.1 hypothetical protein I7I50_05882 [Histoplasma capsulatum G186AR]